MEGGIAVMVTIKGRGWSMRLFTAYGSDGMDGMGRLYWWGLGSTYAVLLTPGCGLMANGIMGIYAE